VTHIIDGSVSSMMRVSPLFPSGGPPVGAGDERDETTELEFELVVDCGMVELGGVAELEFEDMTFSKISQADRL
jgi:hypothetical protein